MGRGGQTGVLQQELQQARPLIPIGLNALHLAKVLDTFAVIANAPREALGCYVISMASEASDILAVQLLLKATGGYWICPYRLCSRHWTTLMAHRKLLPRYSMTMHTSSASITLWW